MISKEQIETDKALLTWALDESPGQDYRVGVLRNRAREALPEYISEVERLQKELAEVKKWMNAQSVLVGSLIIDNAKANGVEF